MANFEIDSSHVSLAMRRLETTDSGHADTFNPLFQQLLNNDGSLQKEVEVGFHEAKNRIDALEECGASITGILSADSWGDSPPYAQTIRFDDLNERDVLVDLDSSEAESEDEMDGLSEALGCITDITTHEYAVMFVCGFAKPEVDIPLKIKRLL